VIESMPLNFTFTGTAAANPVPLTLTLQDGLAPNTVRLTLDATNLSGNEFVSGWYINLNPAFDPSQLTFSFVSNPLPPGVFTLSGIQTGTNAFKADGDGFYDILFSLPPPPGGFANEFHSGETMVVDVTRAAGLSVADFNFQSVMGGGTGTYFTAAHIQGVGADGGLSNFTGASATPTQTSIPEPSVVSLCLGLAAFGLYASRRKRR
jgi:hypothetical protein